MTSFRVGDEVCVEFWSHRRREFPDGFPGKIVKITARYGTAEFEMPRPDPADGGWRWVPASIRFDLRTGYMSPDIEGLRVREARRDA